MKKKKLSKQYQTKERISFDLQKNALSFVFLAFKRFLFLFNYYIFLYMRQMAKQRISLRRNLSKFVLSVFIFF